MMRELQSNRVQEKMTMIEPEPESIFSDFDLYLFGQGKHYHLYDKMGAHPRVLNGVAGVHFAVWAPNALNVSVIGDFNQWNRSSHPMQRRHNDLGVWECFIPGVKVGAIYKFALYSRHNNYAADKIDPYAFAFELVPIPPALSRISNNTSGRMPHGFRNASSMIG